MKPSQLWKTPCLSISGLDRRAFLAKRPLTQIMSISTCILLEIQIKKLAVEHKLRANTIDVRELPEAEITLLICDNEKKARNETGKEKKG